MAGLLALTASVLLGFAVYNLSCAFVDVPTEKTSRTMMTTTRQTGTGSQNLLDVYLTKASCYLSRFIFLDPVRKGKLTTALRITGSDLTPESYTAKSFLTGLLIILCSLPFFWFMPIGAVLLIISGIAAGFMSYQQVFDSVKKRKKLIDREMPRFALQITQSLQTDRDVLRLLLSYRRIAGEEFKAELDTTIADMKTENYENALLRLQNRVGSTLLTEVVRGLIGVLRGDDQSLYFKMLSFDMRQMEIAALKKEAEKRPKAMQKYSMLMLFCILLIYVVVLSVEVFSSVGSFF